VPRVRVEVSADWQEYRRLSKALKDAARRDLQAELRREIRAAGQPALAATRAAVLGVDMSGGPAGRSTGLLARIAAATRLQVLGSGIRFKVQNKQVDPKYGERLVLGSEGTPWRHPVFGNRKAWSSQVGQPWFYPTLRSRGPAFRRAAVQAMHRIMSKIAG
jgi:hypothetical protein